MNNNVIINVKKVRLNIKWNIPNLEKIRRKRASAHETVHALNSRTTYWFNEVTLSEIRLADNAKCWNVEFIGNY